MKPSKKHCLTQQEIEEQLRGAGVQPTLQRILICQFVLCEADHPTAEEVHLWAEKNLAKISLATVYNTLNTLVDAGLLKELKFPHSDKVIYDDNMEEHYHFLDRKSGKLFDIAKGDVKISAQLAKQFQIQGFDLLINGNYQRDLKKGGSL
ncbi:MAG: Fur family transcriptional regulator [Bdellovibrio sp. CG10_big_fil_rev_8_21_14_0_10_47_8]|nr:MAG: Fur family transcriptional regulator [Bdellovibrio sp. CG10_big_fil_rev_8_21_14_0_10_47_8]